MVHNWYTTSRVERPPYVWAVVALEIVTGSLALPAGVSFVTDPSGGSMGLPDGWIQATPFGSYLVPGLYLLLANGAGMLVLAGLCVVRHWLAPWLTTILGAGLVVWILVQVVVLPATMLLTWLFLAIGSALLCTGVAWLRRTWQLRLW